MKNICLSLFVLLTVFCFSAKAQDAISPEKKKLIAEIITVTKADQKVEETMMSMMKQMQAAYPMLVSSTLAGFKDLTDSERAALAEEMIKRNANFSVKFNERLRQKINYREFVEQISFPLYDKFFTQSELKDLLAFYKTPTGQKLNDAIPQMAGESVRLSQEILIPKITTIVNEIIEEDLKTIQKAPPKKGTE